MVIDQQVISEALSRQISWLQTWKTKKGAYNGYVVHRTGSKRMFKIHDTAWAQGPIINGYLNLYQETKDDKWLQEAVQAANLQCTRLHKKGKYIHAGFEDDRFSSLVHNSLANCALLDLAQVLIDEGNDKKAKKYLRIAKTNIDRYIIGVLWDEDFGAFKFSEVDYYSPDVTRFVANMNSVAVESLLKLSSLTSQKEYQDYAVRVGEWMLTQQIKSSDLEGGGISYSQVQPRSLISIYTALAMRGIDDLYYLTKDRRYLEMMKRAAEHLMGLIDPETKLFYHCIVNGDLVRYPQFVAGAGIILRAIDDAERLTGYRFGYRDALDAVLANQLANGGFPSFLGFRNKLGFKNEVWEDRVPVIGWNVHLFEFLTRKVDEIFSYSADRLKKTCVITRNYFYAEGEHSVMIFGIMPIRSWILYFAIKRLNIAPIYVAAQPLARSLAYLLPARVRDRIKSILGMSNC